MFFSPPQHILGALVERGTKVLGAGCNSVSLLRENWGRKGLTTTLCYACDAHLLPRQGGVGEHLPAGSAFVGNLLDTVVNSYLLKAYDGAVFRTYFCEYTFSALHVTGPIYLVQLAFNTTKQRRNGRSIVRFLSNGSEYWDVLSGRYRAAPICAPQCTLYRCRLLYTCITPVRTAASMQPSSDCKDQRQMPHGRHQRISLTVACLFDTILRRAAMHERQLGLARPRRSSMVETETTRVGQYLLTFLGHAVCTELRPVGSSWFPRIILWPSTTVIPNDPRAHQKCRNITRTE